MEDDGVNFEYELKKSKEKECKLKKKWKFTVKDYEKLSKETALIVERFEMLVEKLRTKMMKEILIFQNEEQSDVKEIKQ